MRYGADSLFVYPNPAETIGLAQRAVHHGFRLETDPTGAHFVVEPASGRREFVTGFSCTCRQFVQSGGAGCQHWALLVVTKNWIPEAVAAVEMERSMSPTRRDVLKMAAALPVLGATMTRADALAEFAKPVGNEPALSDKHPDVVFDPSSFAEHAEMGTIYDLTGAHGIETAAAERAEYARARFDLIQLVPELAHDKIRFDHPFIKLNEMMWAICHASYWEGIRAGAAYEHLRQAIVAPTQVCPLCDGVGLLDRKSEKIWDYDRPNPNDVRTCKDCKGIGVVAAAFLKGWTR